MTLTTSLSVSALSRDSAKVFRSADRGPVEVTRRDGESFVLTRKSEYDEHFTALTVAADLIAASLAPEDVPFEKRLEDRFPWLRFLGTSDQQLFAREIIDVARSCAAVHNFGPFLVELAEWRRTAAASAAGFTPGPDLEWLDEPAVVFDPRHSPD